MHSVKAAVDLSAKQLSKKPKWKAALIFHVGAVCSLGDVPDLRQGLAPLTGRSMEPASRSDHLAHLGLRAWGKGSSIWKSFVWVFRTIMI